MQQVDSVSFARVPASREVLALSFGADDKDGLPYTPMPRNKPPNMPDRIAPNINKMIIAGMAAIAHLTIKITIEKNGICISVTTTCDCSGKLIFAPVCCSVTIRIPTNYAGDVNTE